MCKANTGKRIALLLAALAIIATTASAYTPPYRLMVFTDKQVYLDYGYDFDTAPYAYTQDDNPEGSFNQRPNVFAVLIDSDGNIVKGLTGANFSARLKDVERWNHSGPGLANYPYYTVLSVNGQYYNSTNFIFTDADGDGIFNSSNDVTDLNQLSSPPPVTDQVNISINVTGKYQGVNYASTVYVIFGTAGCHHPANGITSAHGKSNHDGVVCTACHWGYQYALGVHGKDNPLILDDPARYSDVMTRVAGYDYKLGRTGGTNATDYNNSGSGYCIMCHGGQKLVRTANLLDLGTGGDGGRPSCSWYQGPVGNGSSNPFCHAPQLGYDGSTKITWSSLNGTDWKGWTAGPGTSKSHNHSTAPKTNGTPCELCHAGGGAPGTGTGGMHQVAGLPNRTSDYSSINDQCRFCHNTTDGWLNITSNGGTARNHSRTNQCSNCHIENNKLNSHNVPIGAYGGKWCLECHNLTGKAPIDMRIDPLIANVSNINYTHYRLNENSDALNSSRICWGCHTNNSMVQNGIVNTSRLAESEHPGNFDTPRNCTSCHNNSNASLNFGAPQTYRHTWYAPDMKTPAITYCTSCHARDEMVNAWDESVYPPKTDNESSAHYGRNRTLSFPQIGSREYCGYCHQNESTVMGPFANPNNEVRSDHASKNTTPGCGNDLCHMPGRMHEDTLVIPVFKEANINTTCLGCHSPSDYSYHNSTLTCWDCHMGNVSNGTATWIHPIQFIQYNGNFTGAKLTGATCYDCHKSTSVDSTIQNLSGKKAPKVYNQAHSSDPNNGTKWGDYWKYTPTTYNFASYYISSGVINPAYPFDNIRVPSNEFMEIIENHTGSLNTPVQFPYNKAESQIKGSPVPNWTSYSKVTAGATTLTAIQDATVGDPPGSLKASIKTKSQSGSGNVSWNYSFYYKPDIRDYAYTTASVEYDITVSSSLAQNVYFRLIKPSGMVVTLANATSSSNTGWLTLTNDSFASALDEDGSVAPYKIQLYTELSGTGTKTVQNPYSVYYDNVILKFQEKVWNRYEVVINTTGVPVNGISKIGMSYQVHTEKTYLQIYNKTSGAYEALDTLDRGVFFDYVKDISPYHIDSSDGVSGNVSVKFIDANQNDTDAVSDKLHIRYLYVFTDRGLQYPCEQCHSPNKHYVNPTIGSPEKFRSGNRYNSSDLKNSTWCQQCHWQGAANYSNMIQEFNVTRKPPENIPPEITGNKTYGKFNTSRDGKTDYVNHTGSAYSDMNDSGCFKCHGKSGDTTTSQFIHNVQVGQSGNRQCTSCHNTSALNTNYRKVDVEAVKKGMHGNLKNASANVSNTSDPIELACWACHGDGTYNNSEQHRNANAWTCDRCHTNATSGKLSYNAPTVYEHIPPNLATPEADIRTTFNSTAWTCADCHNNSINTTALINDNEGAQNAAVTGHYGLNRTAGMLMYDYSTPPKGNSEDCIYCHRSSSANMTKWGINPSSTKNLNNKVSPTDHRTFTNNDCRGCHNYTATPGFTFHNASLGNGSGIGSGPDCKSCHDVGGMATGKLVNFSAMNDTGAIHKNLNSVAASSVNVENRKCWACHDEGAEPAGHNQSRYRQPYNCADCHTAAGIKSGKYPGWNVTEHVKQGTVNGTEIFASQADNCYSCHNMSEMMVGYALDPDGASSDIYGGANGGSNSTSHYGRKRDLGSNDTYCNYCHNNATTTFDFNEPHNMGIIEHTGNSTADIRNSTTLNCTDCHTTNPASYRLHNGTLYTQTVNTWTAGKQDRCAPCHLSTGSGSNLKINNNYHNTTTGDITDCSYCHNSDAMKSSAPQNVHSDNLTRGGNSTFNNCYNCHQNGFTSRTIFEHTNSTGANITNPSMTCEKTGCHNSTRTHSKMLVKPATSIWTPRGNDSCAPCHNSSDSLNNATKKVYRQGHDPATNDNVTSCGNCHNASTPGGIPASFRLHDGSLIRIEPNASTCQGCHNGTSLYVGAKQIFSHMPNASQYRGNTSMSNYTCEYCHNMTNKPSMHSAGMNRSSGTCITCHFNRTSPFKASVKMISAGDYNHTYSGQTSCNTTMCHNASGGSVFHMDKYAAGVVGEPEKFNSSWNNRNNQGFPAPYSPYVDCIDCHREYYNISPFYAPYFEANLTGENKKNHSTADFIDACYNCHTNRTDSKDRYMVHNVTIEPLLGGPSCIRCHNQSAPITSGYPPTNKKVNHTALNQSVHKNLTNFTAWNESKKQNSVLLDSACWTCHATNITELPNNAHPDRGGPAPPKKPFQCEECHTTGGNVSIYNKPVYDNATKVNKHYPGSVFLGTVVFSGNVSCSTCHKNSMVANTNVSGYSNSSKANDINVSHYGTRTGLTNTSPDLNGCQKCHGVGGQGQYSSSYGNARSMPPGHNDMGATPLECAKNCHNSALDESGLSRPVMLHNSSVGIYVGTGNCYATGCHTPPPPCSDDECRR